MQTSLKKWLPLIIIGTLIFLLDQLSKAWVVSSFAIGEGIPLLAPILQIRRSMNTGIAFGIGEGGSAIFLILSSLIILVLLWMYARSKADSLLQHMALALVIGGALGNVIDRIQHGHVVDFVYIEIPRLVSNVSNFADHAIVIGVLLLLLDGFLQEKRERNLEKLHTETSLDEKHLIET